MKVLDLQCEHGHAFEGWFASHDDFSAQQARGLVECPFCGSVRIQKRLSAPRLNLGHAAAPAEPAAPVPGADAGRQATWLKAARELIARTEDVGPRFAEEARRMHYGEAEERSIRGQSTPEQTRALLEEGIPVLPLLLPDALKNTLQ